MTKVKKIICDYTGEECEENNVKIDHFTIQRPLSATHRNIEIRTKKSFHVKKKLAKKFFDVESHDIIVYSIGGEFLFYQEKDHDKMPIYASSDKQKKIFDELINN